MFRLVFGLVLALAPYLRFGEIQLPRELGALATHDVLAPLELELEPVQLLGRERGARALRPVQVQALGQHDLTDGAFSICPRGWGGGGNQKKTNKQINKYVYLLLRTCD